MPSLFGHAGKQFNEKDRANLRIYEMTTCEANNCNPIDTDVFKTSSGRLKKVTKSCNQTRRRQDVLQKTSDLRRLEDIRFTPP